ncbi:LppU/SCO3897 family protein [Streptacidiphilus neutrinimicus]|uniref:LppU/SCO3897 family protein n=1 Tax=Streptacidiphilus neutrinimicus TaxID=105420 RepID=UPI0005AAD033|nr:hypothetical protein [Streptacidiphilus neutrinimicus]
MTTPQNPYQTPQGGQAPQNPYGAPSATVPPQGYPAQPGANPGIPPQGTPPQGYPAPPAAGYATPPAPQKTKRGGGFGKKLLIRLGVVVLLFGAWFVYDQVTGAPDTAKVGDCVQNSGTDANPDVHVVGCSNSAAKFKVLKVIDGTDYQQCAALPGYEAAYTETGGNSSDLVLCLGANK